MAALYAYVRKADDEQAAVVHAFAASIGAHIQAIYKEGERAGSLRFLERPAFGRLSWRLRPGDGVLVANSAFWFTTILDAGRTLVTLREQQVQFAVVTRDAVVLCNYGAAGDLLTNALCAF